MDEISSESIALVTTYGWRVLGAFLILLGGRVVAGILRKTIRRVMSRTKVDVALTDFVTHLAYWAVIVFALVAALDKFGVKTTSFIAVLGAAGLAVGLALQGSLSNFAAGVLILVLRPFRVEDMIRVGDTLGKVRQIGIFATTLTTPDNQKVFLPNSQIMGGKITNINACETRRVDLTAGIGYDSNIAMAKELLEKILAEHPLVLQDPAPVVELVELADSSVNFVVRPWVKTTDYWRVYWDVTRSIKETFDDHDISIPFPQRDVHLFKATA